MPAGDTGQERGRVGDSTRWHNAGVPCLVVALRARLEKGAKSASAERTAPAPSNPNPVGFALSSLILLFFLKKKGHSMHMFFNKSIFFSSPLRALLIMPRCREASVLGVCQRRSEEAGVAGAAGSPALPAAAGNHKPDFLLLLGAC